MSRQLRNRLIGEDNSNNNDEALRDPGTPNLQDSTRTQQLTLPTGTLVVNKIKLESNKMSTFDINTMLIIVPDYDGTPSLLHKFLTCCDIVQKTLTTAKDQEMFLQVLPSKLSGRAYELIKYNEYETFDALKKDLQNQFLDTKSLEQLQNDLVNAKQGPSEEEQTYALRVEQLLSDLNSACNQGNMSAATFEPIRQLNSRTAFRAFQEGLRSPLKLLIKASRYLTLKEAIEASIIEGKLIKRDSPKTFPNVQNKNSNKFCPQCKRSGHSYQECRSKLLCNKCKRIGHSADQCRVNTQIHTTNIICNFCKTSGHSIKRPPRRTSHI